jgi:hypothetical protein
VSRTLPVYVRRAKTLGELLTPDVRRLYPELAALAQVAIDREWANATAEVDAAVRAGLDLLACLTGERSSYCSSSSSGPPCPAPAL